MAVSTMSTVFFSSPSFSENRGVAVSLGDAEPGEVCEVESSTCFLASSTCFLASSTLGNAEVEEVCVGMKFQI